MPKIHRSRDRVMGAKGTPVPEDEDVPPIEFEDPEPPMEVCDRVLGGYVRCWGDVEASVDELFQSCWTHIRSPAG